MVRCVTLSRTWLRTGIWAFVVYAGAILFALFIDRDPALAWGLYLLTPAMLLLWLTWGLAILGRPLAGRIGRFIAKLS
jgi:hypothetical protein